jgi:predicted molibdopterin-dependent oxidoreductase YjgC
VLPAAGLGERSGTTTNIEGRVSRLSQKVVAPGLARADWVIACEIADRLGFDLGFDHVEGIWEEIEEVAPAHHGATVAAVYGGAGIDGVVIPVGSVRLGAIAVGRKRQPLDPIATPGIDSVNTQGAPLSAGAAEISGGDVAESLDLDGLVLAASVLEASAVPELPTESLVPAVPVVARPSIVTFDAGRWPAPAVPLPDSYSLRLIALRSLYDHGTLVQASPSLAGLAPTQQLRMRPKEVEQLGVVSGGQVRIRSARGELIVAVVADERVPAGVATIGLNLTPVDIVGATSLLDSDEPAQMVRVETVES